MSKRPVVTGHDQSLVSPKVLKFYKDQDQDQKRPSFGLFLVLVFFSHGPVQLQFFCSLRTGPLNTNDPNNHIGALLLVEEDACFRLQVLEPEFFERLIECVPPS